MSEFKAKDVISEAVKRTLALLATCKRGDVVPWERIEAVSGFRRGSQHWPAFNRRMRRDFLRQTGILLFHFPPNDGLKVCTTDEQLNAAPQSRQKRALRQFTRSAVEVAATPDKELTDHQRVGKSVKLEQLRRGRKDVLRTVRLGAQLAKPTTANVPRSNSRPRATVASGSAS
jgi:hypothetical protein